MVTAAGGQDGMGDDVGRVLARTVSQTGVGGACEHATYGTLGPAGGPAPYSAAFTLDGLLGCCVQLP